MIPVSDLWMLGLRPVRRVSARPMVPTSGAAQPFRDMGELFPSWAARPHRRLTVGLTCSLHWGSARKLLATFHDAHPDIELVVEDLLEADLADAFDARHIDVAIAPDKAAHARWRALPLWRERLIAALPDASPLAQGNEVSPQDLRGQTLLLAGDVSGQKALQRAIVGALDGHPAAVMHYPVERDTLFDLVAIGIGVTVCPGATTGAFYPGVCFRPIDSHKAEIGYSLMWTQTQPHEALDAFIALAQLPAREETTDGNA
jgi:DNA-binding transcriptional LysR family regulator